MVWGSSGGSREKEATPGRPWPLTPTSGGRLAKPQIGQKISLMGKSPRLSWTQASRVLRQVGPKVAVCIHSFQKPGGSQVPGGTAEEAKHGGLE